MADEFRSLAGDPDRDRYLEHVLSWVYLANKPYLDWLFGGEEVSKGVLTIWMRTEVSEVSLRNIFLYFRDGEPYGGIVCLTGEDLVRARKADAISLMRVVPVDQRSGVLERLKACSHLFDYPATDEYYLAKMGVIAKSRGTGIGKKIFGLSLEAGEALGFRKFRGDVHVDNAAAIKVYQSAGFKVGERRESIAAGLAYVPVTLDRSGA
jgi:ribosomal protein S18 acetylase RimI-like enzyme